MTRPNPEIQNGWAGCPLPPTSPHQDGPLAASDWREMARQVERLVKLGSFHHDLATDVLTWSPGLYDIFMLSPGEPITVERALALFDPEARDELGRRLDAARRSGTSYDLTVGFRSMTGQPGRARVIGQVETSGISSRIVGVIQDVSRVPDAAGGLRPRADRDPLTGLPDRRAFQTHVEQMSVRRGPDETVALCIVDIDRFKMINDTYGQAIGDTVLQAIGRRLADAAGATDFLARSGGDEFALVLSGVADRADLERRATALVEAIRHPVALRGLMIEATVSVGACWAPTSAVSAETVVKQAGIALYKAKLNGRDQVRLFESSFHRTDKGQDRLLDDVLLGLARREFDVHYQPIVDLRTHIVRGWEALIRWNHPTRGALLPGAFMQALIDPRTSVAIGDFVLDTSLHQMRRWLDIGVPVTCAGVNVSEAQLKRTDLVSTITSLLDHYRLTPDRLKIEVLETAFIGHATREIADTIDRLARLGVVSALDDFGTGFASLTHLKQFRVERIKIDRSFVANLGVDGYDQAIVRCMIALGRDLGIRITAEGIETVEQLKMLRELGCDCGQGYLFGRPMKPDDVPGFLARWHATEAALLLG